MTVCKSNLKDLCDDNDDVYFNKLQQEISQNLLSTQIMHTSKYGISKEK